MYARNTIIKKGRCATVTIELDWNTDQTQLCSVHFIKLPVYDNTVNNTVWTVHSGPILFSGNYFVYISLKQHGFESHVGKITYKFPFEKCLFVLCQSNPLLDMSDTMLWHSWVNSSVYTPTKQCTPMMSSIPQKS